MGQPSVFFQARIIKLDGTKAVRALCCSKADAIAACENLYTFDKKIVDIELFQKHFIGENDDPATFEEWQFVCSF